ncbi:MAG TPA: hypothetical protein VJT69_16540 [Pyrinomonadaceae bacterium]|nr:hypothetical protein [Pyrinomonadaceae bacterium]
MCFFAATDKLLASAAEAKAWAEADPSVASGFRVAEMAGRLAMDIHPWMVPEGVLP